MTQHIKSKHSEKVGDFKRGRGRPKKGFEDQNILKEAFIKNFYTKIAGEFISGILVFLFQIFI